jgi:hypothetical protein
MAGCVDCQRKFALCVSAAFILHHERRDSMEWKDGSRKLISFKSDRQTGLDESGDQLYMRVVENLTSADHTTRTCTSSIYTSTYAQLTVEFNCSRIVATLGLSLFIMGLGIGPMLLGPLSYVKTHPLYLYY